MRLEMALQGKLGEYLEKEYLNCAHAVTTGVKIATNGLKNSLRNQVKSSGLSGRLANTWRGDVYPAAKTAFPPPAWFTPKLLKLCKALNIRRLSVVETAYGWLYRRPQSVKERGANVLRRRYTKK